MHTKTWHIHTLKEVYGNNQMEKEMVQKEIDPDRHPVAQHFIWLQPGEFVVMATLKGGPGTMGPVKIILELMH